MAGRITRAAKGGGPTPPAGIPTNGVHPAPLAVLPPAASGTGGDLVVENLAGIRPKPVRWLVPDYIARGVLNLLAGNGGGGKTMTVLGGAAAITTGRCAFGLRYPDPVRGKVVLIQCEDDWGTTTVPRLAAAGADLTKVLRVRGVRMKTDGKTMDFHMGHFQELERYLATDPEIVMVAIDPAGAYIASAGVNENRDADLRAVLGPLSETANKSGAAILLIKHLNKSAGVSAVQRVSGSTGYVNAVRTAFMIAPDPNDPDRKLLMPIKSNILSGRAGGLAYRMVGMPPAEAKELLLAKWPDLDPADLDALAGQLFRQEWEAGAVHADANEVMSAGAKKTGRGGSVESCIDFIRGFLGEHAWPDPELAAAAENAGHSARALRDAKEAMRTEDRTDPTRLSSKPRGYRGAWWVWIGPQSDPPPDRPESPADKTANTDRSANSANSANSENPLKEGGLTGDQTCQSRQSWQSRQSCQGRQHSDPDYPKFMPGDGVSPDAA